MGQVGHGARKGRHPFSAVLNPIKTLSARSPPLHTLQHPLDPVPPFNRGNNNLIYKFVLERSLVNPEWLTKNRTYLRVKLPPRATPTSSSPYPSLSFPELRVKSVESNNEFSLPRQRDYPRSNEWNSKLSRVTENSHSFRRTVRLANIENDRGRNSESHRQWKPRGSPRLFRRISKNGQTRLAASRRCVLKV